jgi:hypothetical protein
MNTTMPLNLNALETSFDLVAPRGDELMDEFYSRLFRAAPAVKPLFPDDLRRQKAMLLAALVLVRKSLRDLDAIPPRCAGSAPVTPPTGPSWSTIRSSAARSSPPWQSSPATPGHWNTRAPGGEAFELVAATMLEGAEQTMFDAPVHAGAGLGIHGKRPRRLTGQHRPAHANTKERQMPCASHTYRASAAARRGCPHT